MKFLHWDMNAGPDNVIRVELGLVSVRGQEREAERVRLERCDRAAKLFNGFDGQAIGQGRRDIERQAVGFGHDGIEQPGLMGMQADGTGGFEHDPETKYA